MCEARNSTTEVTSISDPDRVKELAVIVARMPLIVPSDLRAGAKKKKERSTAFFPSNREAEKKKKGIYFPVFCSMPGKLNRTDVRVNK